MSDKKAPVKTLRMGALKAAIWANSTDKGTFHSVTFSRSYKVGEDWKESDSYGADDLLALAKLADLAHTQIFKLREEAKKSEGGK